LTFESVANQFGIAPKVDLPYNEQVKNALIMLSRIKAGASEQELAFVTNLKNGLFTQFGKEAFGQAKKILSQVGDECLQLMVSASEAGLAGISPEGKTDFKCGNIKFAVNSQGEISLSNSDMTQESKHMRNTINRSMMQVMQDPTLMQKDPFYAETVNTLDQIIAASPTGMMTDATFERLSKDPNMIAMMQAEPVISASGQNLGTMILPTGELNPAISYKKFEDDMDRTVQKFISLEKSKKAPFMRNLVQTTLTNFMRGDGTVDPESAPSHLVTGNGIFPMSDEYFSSVSSNGTVNIEKKNKNFSKDRTDEIAKFNVVVEQKQEDMYAQMKEYLYSVLTPIPQTAQEALAGNLSKNYNFDMNVSLLPGVKPKDIRGVQYNTIRIHGKSLKIPVARDQELVAMDVTESYIAANSLLIESLENDDVLKVLFEKRLINFIEAQNIVSARENGIDSVRSTLIETIENVRKEIEQNPNIIEECFDLLTEAKRKRNYKREYKLFHGKPSQIKKRAARVKARRQYEKEGKVSKGDGKDVDHVKPLRNGGSTGKGNLRVRDRSANRSDNGKYKGQPADKPKE
jgi:ABC-type oligopeptide transport system ATPase subunit